jgi:capsular exopolysaccharide synthesis family protein
MNIEISPLSSDPSSAAPDQIGSPLVRGEGEQPTRLPIVLSAPNSVEAECIRALRTRFVAQHVQEGRRSIAVCTPAVDTGCTFVATNLAAAISQIGLSTVLVDANLRDPGVTDAFGLKPKRGGLSAYLSDSSKEIDDIIIENVLPDLAIIPAGEIPHNPQELLSGSRFPYLVDRLLREFDLTIFDTTPTNSCTDAQRVANVAGYSLIVGRKHKSFFNDVKTLSQLLGADRSVVIGTVLNDF